MALNSVWLPVADTLHQHFLRRVPGVRPGLCQRLLPQFAGFFFGSFSRQMHGRKEETAVHVHTQLVPEWVCVDFRMSKRTGIPERPDATRVEPAAGGPAVLDGTAPPIPS